MPRVLIPAPYRGPTLGESQVEVEADTVRACIEAVERAHPGFRIFVFEPDGALQRFTKLFRNGDPVPLEALDEPVAADDEIQVMTGVAGG